MKKCLINLSIARFRQWLECDQWLESILSTLVTSLSPSGVLEFQDPNLYMRLEVLFLLFPLMVFRSFLLSSQKTSLLKNLKRILKQKTRHEL